MRVIAWRFGHRPTLARRTLGYHGIDHSENEEGLESRPSHFPRVFCSPLVDNVECSLILHQVLIVSFIGAKGRILQAHYDGDNLYVRYSPLYDFGDYQMENIDLFLRWILNEPIGNTAILSAQDDAAPVSMDKSPSMIRHSISLVG